MANEYTDLIKKQQSEDLQSSMYVGTQQNPDTEASLQKLADRVGLPVDAVRQNKAQVEAYSRLSAFDVDSTLKNSPKLAAWLMEPGNAAVAHDDTKSLGLLEGALSVGKDYGGALVGGVVGDAIGRTMTGAVQLLDVGARAIDRPVRSVFGDKVADAFWYEPAKVGGVALDPLASLKSTGQSLKTLGDWMKPATENQTLGTDVAGGIGQIGGQIATFFLTGGAATVGTMMAQGADVMADKVAKDIADPAMKDAAIIAGGAITAITEKYGLDKILNRVPPEIKNRTLRFLADKLAAGGIEAAQEFSEGLLHDLARKMLTNKDAEVLDGVGREMTAAGLSAMIVRTALGVKGHRAATQNEEQFRAILDASKQSALLERYPDKFRQYVESITKDGPIENVFIPADQFRTYFQDANIDPAVMASKLGVQNYAEAVNAGGDVVIPTANFLSDLASTDHLQGLSQDIKFNQGDWTPREAKNWRDNQGDQEIDLETLKRMTGVDVTSVDGFEEMKQQMIGELVGRFDASTANAYATNYAAAITTLAQRMGMKPADLADRYRLSVNMPLPTGLKTLLDKVDVDIDPLLERLRSGDIPSEALAFGQSLSEFIRESGGLKDQGETRDLDQGPRKPGQKKMVQANGMSLDAALQAAIQAGYFGDVAAATGLTETDLLNALGEDMAGARKYSAINEQDQAARELRTLRGMADFLDSIGADLSTMSNAQIRKMIDDSAAEEVAAGYDQAVTSDMVRELSESLLAKHEGLKLSIYGGVNGKPLTISRIEVAQRSGGVGTQVMDEIMAFADAHGVTVALTPSKDFGGTVSRLKVFYGRFGFVENKGKNKDYEISESMYRLPQVERSYNQDSTPQSETAAFKNWFGNSKVVDADGKPLVMYHGTAADFDTFDNAKTGANDRGLWGKGHYFASVVTSANSYAERQGDGARVMPVYVSIKNPLILTTGTDFITRLPDGRNSRELIGPNLDGAKIKEIALSGGHDGVIQIRPNGLIGDVVAYQPDQIKSAIGNSGAFDPANPNILYQGKPQGPRGRITVNNDHSMQISLFENANLSTMLHELGHFYLEVMGDLATDANAPQQIKDDYQAIRNWMGLAEGDSIEVVHHEMFARANEAYLMEGKAPNPELHGVFQRFKAWMTQIYKKLHALNVPMSDDIRGVFDRIYATDEQIEAARQEGIYNESFATAADAGMTDAEFKAYQRAVEQTVERGKERLQKKLMDEYQREQDKQWRINRKAMRDEVEKEVDAQPVYVALKALSTGETEDGLTVKLDYKELKALYGKDFTHALPQSGGRAVYATKGAPSIDLETAAEVLGFDSGRAMIEQLVNMQPRDELVKSITDQRMKDFFGDIRFDGTFADQANLALHNDARENMLKIELRAIRKKAQEVGAINRAVKSEQAQAVAAGEQMVKDSLPQKERTGRTKDGREYQFMAFDPEPMKRAAAGLIGQKQVRDVRPYGYLLAERKAAQAFAKAMKDGDYMMAAEQKQRELFNHYLYREASAVAEEVKKKAEYLADQGTKKQREKLGKAGANYLDQVDAILERYEFKDVPLSQLDRRESLAQFVAQQEAMGNAVSIPEELLDEARQVNWKSIPVDELRAVYDSVKNIKHLSGLKNELLVADKKRKFEDVVGSLLTSIETSGLKANSEAPQLNEFEKGAIDRIKGQFKRWDSALLKAEQIFQWFDGGDPTGPWSRTLMGMAADAQNKEYDLHKQVTMSLNEIRKAMPDGWRKSLGDKVGFEIPIVDGNGVLTNANPTRYTMLSIALNMGNEQNMQRLRDGNRLDDSHFQKIRENMTQADWQFVQGVWDSIEGLWPEMAALEKRASGLEPVKVKAESFEVDGVTYRGGYFPLVYDSKISKVGEKQVESAQTVDQFLSSGVGRPTTNKGATKARQATVNQPLKLDMNNVLGSHISKVVKDISHREAIGGIHRILSDSRIKTAIQERMGDAYYQELRNWNAALVADNTGTLTASNDFARFAIKARTNLSIAVMGWKFGTALSQFGGLPVALDIVKARHLATAASKFATSPLASYAMVTEKSGEMRGRLQNRDRDVREALYKLADKQDLKSDIQRSAFIMTGMADLAVAVPTWMAGYEQAITEGKSEADAVAFGDHAVRMSQGGGGAKDLAGVQRNNEFLKIMTMFYTPFSALYARLRDIGHTTAVEGVGYLPMAVARFAAVAIFPAIISQVLAGRGPDDDEDKVWWAVRQMITYPMAAIPIVRDFAGLVEQQVIKATGDGKMDYAPSYSLSPISQAIGKAYKALLENPLAVATGQKEFDAQMGWKAVESAGFVFGLPTSQVSVSGSYLLDLMNGDANPENAWEIVRDFLFRRKKE